MIEKVYFEFLPNNAFFRFPGKTELFQKLSKRYYGTKEVNCRNSQGVQDYINPFINVIMVNEDDPIPSEKDLKRE